MGEDNKKIVIIEDENGIKYDVYKKLESIEDICNFYALGKQIYDTIRDSIDSAPGTEVIVSPANLGDTVFIATLAAAYKKAHNVERLILVAKNRQADAAEWFEGVDGTVGLEDFEMLSLRYYFVITRKFYANGIRFGHIPCDIDWRYPASFFHIPPGFGELSLMNVWRQRILDVPDDLPLGDIIISEDMIPYENEEKYKNAVLIAPAAFTNKGIPEVFWEKLVAEVRSKGYDVYCNSGGLSYDTVIPGSRELVLSTKELILNAGFFKHIVAVRSGFTDLVSKTDAKLTVLHLGGTTDTPLRTEYGTALDDVRDLGRMEGIYPIKYCAIREDEIIKLILEDIEEEG